MRLEERAERKVAAAYGLTREGSHDEHFLDKYLADAHEWYEKECIVNYYARTSHPKKREKLEKVLENPQLLRTPVVRNGKKATVGYTPEIWETWD